MMTVVAMAKTASINPLGNLLWGNERGVVRGYRGVRDHKLVNEDAIRDLVA